MGLLDKSASALRFIVWSRLRRIPSAGLGRLDGFPVLIKRRGAVLRLGRRVRLFRGVRFELTTPEASVSIGSRTYLNRGVEVHCATSVAIGEDCAIAWGVLIMDNDAHSINGVYGRSPITIGDRVWIGQGARILKGVSIGDGAVVGAGSIVTKDVLAGSVVAGSPAREIASNVRWDL
jgi:acetyltransferase-like isoleucine patch superfamily enzyme